MNQVMVDLVKLTAVIRVLKARFNSLTAEELVALASQILEAISANN